MAIKFDSKANKFKAEASGESPAGIAALVELQDRIRAARIDLGPAFSNVKDPQVQAALTAWARAIGIIDRKASQVRNQR